MSERKRNVKRNPLIVVFAAILIVFALAVHANIAAAKQELIKLRFSSGFMPNDIPNIYANHTLDLVEQKTNGGVKIERFMGGALGAPHEQLDLASSGAVDIISLHVDQYAQQLPLHQVINTEQLTSYAQGIANVIAITKELEETKPLFEAEAKRNNIKILHFYAFGSTGITARFPATSLADVKGKKINVVAAFHREVFKEIGWIPVNVKVQELYEALSRGVIDGTFIATVANVPLKLFEIGKVHLVLGQNMVASLPLAFNLDRWNSLPPDIQKAFLEASWETAQWSIQQTEMIEKGTYKKFEEVGAKVITVSTQERNSFFSVLLKYSINNWLNNCKKAGIAKDAVIVQKYWDEMKWGRWKK